MPPPPVPAHLRRAPSPSFRPVERRCSLSSRLHHRHRPPAVADPIVGRGGQQAGQREGEHRLSGVDLHPFGQPVASLLVAPEADERHRDPNALGETRVELREPARSEASDSCRRPLAARARPVAGAPRRSPARTSPPPRSVRSPRWSGRSFQEDAEAVVRPGELRRPPHRPPRTAPRRREHRRSGTTRCPAGAAATGSLAPARVPCGNRPPPPPSLRRRALDPPELVGHRSSAAIRRVPPSTDRPGESRHRRAVAGALRPFASVAQAAVGHRERIVDVARLRVERQRLLQVLDGAGVILSRQRRASRARTARQRAGLQAPAPS